MINKDKCFKSILKEVTQELNTFRDLKVSPSRVYFDVVEPLITKSCDKFWGDEHIYYSLALRAFSFDQRSRDIALEIALYVKEVFEPKFKQYKISITFQSRTFKDDV